MLPFYLLFQTTNALISTCQSQKYVLYHQYCVKKKVQRYFKQYNEVNPQLAYAIKQHNILFQKNNTTQFVLHPPAPGPHRPLVLRA